MSQKLFACKKKTSTSKSDAPWKSLKISHNQAPPPAQLSFPHREPGAFHEVIEFLAQLGGVGHGFPPEISDSIETAQIMGCLNQKSVTEKQLRKMKPSIFGANYELIPKPE